MYHVGLPDIKCAELKVGTVERWKPHEAIRHEGLKIGKPPSPTPMCDGRTARVSTVRLTGASQQYVLVQYFVSTYSIVISTLCIHNSAIEAVRWEYTMNSALKLYLYFPILLQCVVEALQFFQADENTYAKLSYD